MTEIICFVGLVNLLCFSQTIKNHSFNRTSDYMGLVAIPSAISYLVKIWSIYGWWTLLFFIFSSFVAGVSNSIIARKYGIEFIYSLQPYHGIVFINLSIICWLI